jgi:hypothetical protein
VGKDLRVLEMQYFFFSFGSIVTGFDSLLDLPSSSERFSEMFVLINYRLVDEHKPRRRWEDNIKRDLQEVGRGLWRLVGAGSG